MKVPYPSVALTTGHPRYAPINAKCPSGGPEASRIQPLPDIAPAAADGGISG